VVLDMIGTGPLSRLVAEETARLGLERAVTLHGHLSNPYSLVGAADAMVLPSLSEGIARAALEALYLGVPCVLREADANAELILDSASGALFRHDDELSGVMLACALKSRDENRPRPCLLPPVFREQQAARRYLELIEQSS
jgi:glycosyltransferase involved in cell wall biosynthesis